MSTEEKLVMDLLDLEQVFDPQQRRKAASAISRLSAEVQELREALKPFAELAEGEPDTVMLRTDHRHFRRARAAIKPETGK